MGRGKGKKLPASDAKEGSSKRSSNLRWTAEQDETLRGAVEKFGKKKKVDWEAVASTLKGKDADTCEMRWTLHFTGLKTRQYWSPQENEKLLELVVTHNKDWGKIAKEMPGRDVKQCRARYDNYLDPNRKMDKNWEADERDQLRTHMEKGGKLADIANSLNRPQSAVKQQWYKIRDGEVEVDAAAGSGLNRGEVRSHNVGQEKVARKGKKDESPDKDGEERRQRRKKSNPTRSPHQ